MFGIEFILAGFVGVGHSLFGINHHCIPISTSGVNVDSTILFSLDVVRIDVGEVMPQCVVIRVGGVRHVEKLEETDLKRCGRCSQEPRELIPYIVWKTPSPLSAEEESIQQWCQSAYLKRSLFFCACEIETLLIWGPA